MPRLWTNVVSTPSVGPGQIGPQENQDWSVDLVESAMNPSWITDALERFEAPLLRYATRLSGCPQRAADVVQDAFLALCRQRPEAIADHLAPWLFTTVRHRLIDHQRKERPMHTMSAFSEAPGPSQDPAAGMLAAERQHGISQALQSLSPRQREVLHLKFEEGMRYHEIAAALGLSPGTIAKTIHEAIARLRLQSVLNTEA